ncbi:MAG: chemotaxis protein CheX [Myxococcota bacterium]
MSNQELLRSEMSACGVALFDAYGLGAQQSESPRAGEELDLRLAAVIGFSGQKVRGTLMLAIDEGALRRSLPPGSEPRDWLAELANQLLGRFKNRLARFGVDLTISTPLVILGERLSPSVRGATSPLRWALGADRAHAWLDAELAPDVTLVESKAMAEVTAEGELLLF